MDSSIRRNLQDLYIGNPTKQVLQFSYFPVDPRDLDHQTAHRHQAKFLQVPVGGQAKIPDLQEIDLNFILRQHEPYGMIEYTEVDKRRESVSMIYSVGKPIPAKALEKAVHLNEDRLALVGREVRQHAAVAGHENLNDALSGFNTPTRLKALEVEVVEEKRDQRDGSPEINEGVRVTPDPIGAGPRRRRHAA